MSNRFGAFTVRRPLLTLALALAPAFAFGCKRTPAPPGADAAPPGADRAASPAEAGAGDAGAAAGDGAAPVSPEAAEAMAFRQGVEHDLSEVMSCRLAGRSDCPPVQGPAADVVVAVCLRLGGTRCRETPPDALIQAFVDACGRRPAGACADPRVQREAMAEAFAAPDCAHWTAFRDREQLTLPRSEAREAPVPSRLVEIGRDVILCDVQPAALLEESPEGRRPAEASRDPEAPGGIAGLADRLRPPPLGPGESLAPAARRLLVIADATTPAGLLGAVLRAAAAAGLAEAALGVHRTAAAVDPDAGFCGTIAALPLAPLDQAPGDPPPPRLEVGGSPRRATVRLAPGEVREIPYATVVAERVLGERDEACAADPAGSECGLRTARAEWFGVCRAGASGETPVPDLAALPDALAPLAARPAVEFAPAPDLPLCDGSAILDVLRRLAPAGGPVPTIRWSAE